MVLLKHFHLYKENLIFLPLMNVLIQCIGSNCNHQTGQILQLGFVIIPVWYIQSSVVLLCSMNCIVDYTYLTIFRFRKFQLIHRIIHNIFKIQCKNIVEKPLVQKALLTFHSLSKYTLKSDCSPKTGYFNVGILNLINFERIFLSRIINFLELRNIS